MDILNISEVHEVTGRSISIGEAVAMGGFVGEAGVAGAGSILVGCGYAGHSFGTAIDLVDLGRRLVGWLYDVAHKKH
ncbi:hypothetical protein [Salinimonas iocasae]|uniref:Uncharacterized protein n=1 Tax=Salinimonas iocasae TaxID=2572577 RepID=A0A5B7YA36_9ALTE|nr:hypothetical protein [Salinimonas iocasae]QCZ92310.1 hypothetical protein FBQ74_01930 [Salinimonas iocasae]